MLIKKQILYNLILCIGLLILHNHNAFSIKSIDFYKVIIQSTKDTSVAYKNKQLFGVDSGIVIQNIQLKKGSLSSFSCLNYILQKDSLVLNLRCTPIIQGFDSDTLILVSNYGNIPIQLKCMAFCQTALNAPIILDKDTLKCNTNDTILIPITLPQFNISDIVSFRGSMKYNPTIIKPLFGDITVQNQQFTHQVDFNIPIQNSDSIIVFRFLSSWGNENISTIVFSDFKIDSCNYVSNVQTIPIKINVCTANGTRLFFTGNPTNVEMVYGDSSPILRIVPGETGDYTYSIFALNGRLIFSNIVQLNKMQHIAIPIANIPRNSMYYMVLQCPDYTSKICSFIW